MKDCQYVDTDDILSGHLTPAQKRTVESLLTMQKYYKEEFKK